MKILIAEDDQMNRRLLLSPITWRTKKLTGAFARVISLARLQWMRRHHLAHHKGVPGRYGVLFPILDHLFAAGRAAPKTSGQL